LQAAVLIALGVALGVAANLVSPRRIPWVYQAEQAIQGEGVRSVDLAEAKRLYDEGKALFVDARSAREFAAGHVKGAFSLPEVEMDAKLPEFQAKTPLDRPLVAYCSGTDCNASAVVGNRLADEGYLTVYVFFGGWPEWTKAGFPTGGAWN
jgi:rhodanese-related sulfurtransferase